MKQGISIIVPVLNEAENIAKLIQQIDLALSHNGIAYEVIFIDDHSTDNTASIMQRYASSGLIRYELKRGNRGKAEALLQGFTIANYDTICMIDGDLQYPPQAIPPMYKKIQQGADIVVANRKHKEGISHKRRLMSNIHAFVFNKFLHNVNVDVQSGLKVFKSEILERLPLSASGWSFDLPFLLQSRDGGYTIESYDITFSKRNEGKSKVAMLATSLQIALSAVKYKLIRPHIIPFSQKIAQEKGNGFHYKGQEYVHHSTLHHSESAFHRLSGKQIGILASLLILLVLSFLLSWHTTLITFVAVITSLYFVDLLFNFYLIYRSFSQPAEISVSDDEITGIHDTVWPQYTVFCPLYREWSVLPQFITAMSKLDYPKNKLQVMLLLEEDDTETINKVKKYELPFYFDIVIVPHSFPKTKPKACNYGLQFATGEYVVIYDAEDIPDPLQLKKSILAFAKSDDKTVCIQAKLNFYNPHQNLLTRVFTAEYSLWFDLVLTGLQSINAPIPLGGTSNHFRTNNLLKLDGWDSFNVTEDCDLGMRLIKKGYTTAIISSETLEEANSGTVNWFWQRTRWIKGYIQTYFLHMRDPFAFAKDWKNPHMLTFQLVVGGKILSMIVNPFMWLVTFSYFAFRSHIGLFIESFFPTPVLYMGVFSLIVGNFLYMYYYMIGCAKHGHHELTKYVFLVPMYWLAMSMASWVALYKFITAPHHWSKTKHGFHLDDQKEIEKATDVIGRDLIDDQVFEREQVTKDVWEHL